MEHEHEIRTPGPLLDARGRLREPGWARTLVFSYDRKAVAAPRWRIKEWDYYCVLAEEHGLCLTVADLGYMGLVSATVLDFAKRREVSDAVMPLAPMGSFALPSTSASGVVDYRKGPLRLRFESEDGKRRLSVRWPGFARGQGLEAEIALEELPPRESMVIATPFHGAPHAFYYNQKVNCQEASGQCRLGGVTRSFTKGRAFGVLDWGRGVWTWKNTWLWGSASGRARLAGEDVRFGFNLGYGFGDTTAAGENMVFVDGAAHKVGRLDIALDDGNYLAPWRARSRDGRLDLTLSPELDRHAATDFVVLASIQHQVFGRWDGTVTLADGRVVEVRGLRGFCEKVRNRW